MLLHLEIKNFALIDNLEIEPGPGLNILTGETGAGKTIILDALGLILGDRASTEMVRQGKDKALIQGIFSLTDEIGEDNYNNIINFFNEIGVEFDKNDDLIISREITNNKSILRINGTATTISNLRKVTNGLVDIHGQHQHQSLLNEKNHLDILDAYGGKEILKDRNDFKEKYFEREKKQKELKELKGDPKERERRIDLLKFQLDEIESADLKPGEEEELQKTKKKLLNFERLKSGIYKAYDTIYQGETETSVTDKLGVVLEDLNELKEMDDSLTTLVKEIETALIHLEEASQELGTYYNDIELEPEELHDIEERIDKINDLKRKYGNNIDEILNYKEEIIKEIEWLENSRSKAQKIEKEIIQLDDILKEKAEQLNEKRKHVSKLLAKDISKELMELAMEKVQFEVSIKETSLNPKGSDKVEFLISPNPGEPLKPLSKIASGGELARIMLALKTVLSKVDNIRTLIFDEIDTGISGKAAQKVGIKLENLSKEKQILCVTHLPQIAAKADRHFNIYKEESSNKTFTNIIELEEDKKIQEIARMLDGSSPSEISLSHAKKMLKKEN
ncbi:DNA repair protein RecN [Natranaerofaba carboxydovora]|uniref:DNA repair protein RecN n=1 Tax=Natranaerofaba carboxydovora TaxID=2742683 RepID=UPI001F1330A1|nr:DNA repair protein RecN [Natranaerofaba carboxydovora]UMZ73942.1 DNA repair protein RecN [Natranaerofaba carboxydovora]